MIISSFLYILFIFLELVFFILFAVYMVFLVISHLKGSPYVPSNSKVLDEILKAAKLKRNTVFYDLGCGDGRVVKKAVEKYSVKGYGFDINPLLLFISRLFAKLSGLKNIYFINQNINQVGLKKADVVYVFLMPNFLDKLKPKFLKDLRRGTLVISHGFKIEGWNGRLFKKLDNKPFPTYFYRI